MERFLFALFIALDAWVAGAAAFGAAIAVRLAVLADRDRRLYAYMALSKGGYALTSGILLWAVAQVGVVQSNPRTWFYLFGLAAAGVGFTGVSGLLRDQLVDREQPPLSEEPASE